MQTSVLISEGSPVLLPQPLSNIYHELAQVYTTNNPAELRSLVSRHGESFTRDNNTGLVKQCLSSLYKKNIQRLTKVGGPGPVTSAGSSPTGEQCTAQQRCRTAQRLLVPQTGGVVFLGGLICCFECSELQSR